MTDTDVPAGPGDGDDGGDVGSPISPWWRRWWVWTAAAAVVLVAVGVTIWAVQDDDTGEDATPTTTTTRTTTESTTRTTSTTPTTMPTTIPPPAFTLEALSEQMATVAPASLNTPAWECQAAPRLYTTPTTVPPVTTGPLTTGSLATCIPSTLPTDGEYPVVTVLVLDDVGTYTAALSGVAHLLLWPIVTPEGGLSSPPVPPGLNCTNLLAPDSPFTQAAQADQLTPEQTYFGVVMYYFLQDRSPLMDIDDNGIPCETLIEPSVVDTVWAGGWIASRFD